MRKSLYPSSSLAALTVAICAMPQVAQANGFLGTPTVQSGSVTFDRTPLTSETITVDSSRAIINWVPDDNSGTAPFTFLPTGNVVNFAASTAQQSTGPYVVLNRILPSDTSRAALFDGIVNDSTGGNGIWFYTPGGFIVGANARFNVGNTVLSTGDFAETAGEFFPGSASFSVNNTVGSNAAIRLNPGAQINATAEGSFVVAVAPRVFQGGAITVNGSAALVAAEVADFTYNAGLFDIVVTQGVNGGLAVQHTGTTTGPASSSAGDNHRIYMVAIPKNDFISMEIAAGGQLGFDIAGAANVDGNAIVLSVGHNVVGVGAGDPFSATPTNATLSDLRVDGGEYTSNVMGIASGNAAFLSAFPITTANMNFASDLTVRGGTSADVRADGGSSISVTGNLTVVADASSPLADGSSRTGGFAGANTGAGANSTLTVGGNVQISSIGTGATNLTGAVGGNGTGGTAILSSGGGALTVNGSVNLTAQGFSRVGTSTGGTGLGGDARIVANNGGAITIGGSATVDALGQALSGNPGTDGGNGSGGTASISQGTGGTVSITGNAVVVATGIGGANFGGGDLIGGTGRGGDARLVVNDSTISVGGNVNIVADGFGGVGGSSTVAASGGTGIGGLANIGSQVGTLSVVGDSGVSGSGFGGSSFFLGSGGDAVGGQALVGVINGALAGIGLTGNNTTSAIAFGGGGIGAGNRGGNATAGFAQIFADAGTIDFTNSAVATAGASGGSGNGGANGGSAQGGTATFTAGNGTLNGRITVGTDLQVGAFASSGNVFGPGGGSSAAATAGTATLSATGATSSVDVINSAAVEASAFSGNSNSGNAGLATGGLARILGAGGSVDLGSTVSIQAGATGGTAGSGAGGGAVGGNASMSAAGGLIVIASAVDQRSFAGGGDGLTGGIATGGRGFAGTSANGLLDIGGTLTIDHSSRGGSGTSGSGGNAGSFAGSGFGLSAGSGGSVRVRGNFENFINANGGNSAGGNGGEGRTAASANIFANGGTVQVDGNFLGQATGTGGSVTGAGIAGNGFGGFGGIQTVAPASAVLVTGTTNVLVEGRGGAGTAFSATGANGSGGFAFIVANGGPVTLNGTSLTLGASGLGGTAAAGGTGTGGRVAVGAQAGGILGAAGSSFLTVNGQGGNAIAGRGGDGLANSMSSDVFVFEGGTVSMGAIQFSGNVTGGAGGAGASGGGAGGRGGDAIGGIGVSIGSTTGAGTMTTGNINVSANGIGGAGGVGGIGATGGTGGAGGIGRGGFSGAGTNDQTMAGSAGNFTFGTVQVRSNGTGGAGGAGGSGTIQGNGGAGGTGQGGTASFGGSGGTIVATGTNYVVDANGAGGAGGSGPVFGNGGSGTGGTATTGARVNNITPALTSRFTLNGNLVAGARGFGGASGVGGTGGNGLGGISRNGSTGASATYNGNVATPTTGFGGSGGTGGNGTGGTSEFLSRSGATVAVNGNLTVSGSGTGGGATDIGASSGNGTGGNHTIFLEGGSSLTVSGTTGLVAAGSTFDSLNGNGGIMRGGTSRVSTDNVADLGVFAGGLTLQSQADFSIASAGIGANAIGGTSEILANAGTIRITGAASPVELRSFAIGGDGASGGSATGGTARIHASNGGRFEAAFTADVFANAIGGVGNALAGGNATGGLSEIQAVGGGASSITILEARVDSRATGGFGLVTSGNGLGGTARVATASPGDVLSFTDLEIEASGNGGSSMSGAGGSGTGGQAIIFLPTGTISATEAFVDAQGNGGSGGTGGTGTGGRAEVFGISGTLNISGSIPELDIEAEGIGGDGSSGNGGNAIGGFASLRTTAGGGGSVNIVGSLNLEASAEGGSATGTVGNGGNATMGGTQLRAVQSPITVGGVTLIENFGIGGSGVNGGSVLLPAMGPSGPAIQSNNTTITLGDINVQTYGIGGDGRDGGTGGNALSASFFLVTEDGNVAIPSIINGGNLTVDARAIGGAGGDGISGATGGNGGAGGNAIGSNSQVFARATNGRITLGAIVHDGRMTGGAGGAGGAGSAGAGGAGGAGGSANDNLFMSRFDVGTFSGAGAPTIQGFNRSTSVSANLSATGGAGGASGLGTTNGTAGAGGSAIAGGITMLVRGSEVTSGAVSFTATATGGDGGINNVGQIVGLGGNATGGGAVVLASPHFVTTTETATATLSSFTADTSATGGAGGISGGNATGGESAIRLEENGTVVTETGTVTVAGPVMLNASANGGSGRTGAGGTGTGGMARVENLKGTVAVQGAATANAIGRGGLSQNSAGGVGTGGTARIGANGLATMVGGTLNLNALGQGGGGLNGGAALGGTASAVVTSGMLGVTGASTINANALGGVALVQLGGRGGDATAGIARAEADSPAANVILNMAGLTASALANGGAGGSYGAIAAALGLPPVGGRGGNATGGSIAIGSTSSAGTLSFGAVFGNGTTSGGAGGAAGTFGPGGVGGNAIAGTSRIGFGGTPGIATGTMSAASILGVTVAFGGEGGTGTLAGAGGNATGGTSIVGNLAGGALTVAGGLGVGAGATVVGTGATANAGNALLLTSVNPNAGGASSVTAGGVVNIQANGLIGTRDAMGMFVFQPLGAAGAAAISADGGAIAFASAILQAGGAGTPTSVAPFRGIVASGVSARNASIQSTGVIDVQAGGGNAAIFTDNGNINTGGFATAARAVVESLNGVAPVAPGALVSTGSVSVTATDSILTRTRFQSAGQIDIVTPGSVTIGGAMAGGGLTLDAGADISGGDIVADGLFEVVTANNLTFGTIRAESDIDLTAGGSVTTGALSTGDSVLIASGGSVTTGNIDAGVLRPSTDSDAGYGVGIRANGGVSTGTITARGPVGLGSETGSVSAGAVQTQDSVLVLARTGASLGAVSTATDGTIYIADSSMVSLLDPVTLDPAPIFAATPVALAGPVTIGAVGTNRFVSASTGAFTAQGGITALSSVDVRTVAAATFNGAVSSPVITVRSGDLVLGTGGGLGGQSTQRLDLLVDPQAAAVAFGGSGLTTGYSLSGDEASRLRAQTISFSMQMMSSQPAPQLTLGSFILRGGNATQQANLLGSAGTLRIVTPGAIAVTGAALVNDAVAGNIVEIVAGGRIEINANSGTIRLTNGTELAGGLRLSGSDIWSADATTLEMLRDNVDFTGRDARLNAGRSTSSGVPTDGSSSSGMVSGIGGGTITISVDDTLLIANSGTAREQAGFESGMGGIAVSARVASPRPGQQSPTADLPPGTIDVVINGTARDSSGATLTGRRTIEAFQLGSGTTATPNSSVNGCNLGTSVCAGGQGDPVTMATFQASTEPLQLTEQAAEDAEEAEEAVAAAEKRPSAVVSRLIDGASVENTEVIDEPVSGGGNPSLWETAPAGEPR